VFKADRETPREQGRRAHGNLTLPDSSSSFAKRPSHVNVARRARCEFVIQALSARSRPRKLASEHRRREGDIIVRTTAVYSGSRQIPTTRGISLGAFASIGTGEHCHLALET
jgi:hypothetical protein